MGFHQPLSIFWNAVDVWRIRFLILEAKHPTMFNEDSEAGNLVAVVRCIVLATLAADTFDSRQAYT